MSRIREPDFTELKDFMRKEKPDFDMIGGEAFKAVEDCAYFDIISSVEIPGFAKELGIETWAQYALK